MLKLKINEIYHLIILFANKWSGYEMYMPICKYEQSCKQFHEDMKIGQNYADNNAKRFF